MFTAITDAIAGLPPWLAVVVVVGVSVLAAVAVNAALRWVLRVASTRTETTMDELVLAGLRLPLVLTFALAGVFVLTRSPEVVASVPLTQTQVNDFFDRPTLTALVFVWAWALNAVVNRAVEAVKDGGPRFDFAPVLSNVFTLVVAVGAVGLTLAIWRIDITPLLAGAGIAGIAVGFAAKDTVANFFGGIALYFDDTYKLGDYVVLDSGEKGTVVKVGVRSTTLQTRDEVLITVPNSVLNSAKIVNESAPGTRKRIRVPVGVAYGTDLDAFEGAVLDVAEDEPLVLDTPLPRMRFRSFGDSALQYELLCWVRSPLRASKATHLLNRAIYDRLAAEGIEIPYTKVDVTLTPSATADAIDPAPERDADAVEATDGGEKLAD